MSAFVRRPSFRIASICARCTEVTDSFSFAIALPVTLLLSVATYYVIEKPFLSLRRPYLGPQKVSQAQTVSSSIVGHAAPEATACSPPIPS